MAIAHFIGRTKFSLVLRGPNWTAVIAACFPSCPVVFPSRRCCCLRCRHFCLSWPRCCLRCQRCCLCRQRCWQSSPLPFASCLKQIIFWSCYRLLRPPCRSENEAVVKDNNSYWSRFNADGHCAFIIYRRYGGVLATAIFTNKFHWTVSDEPIGNENATSFWYKLVMQFRFGVIEYTCPRALLSVVYIR